MELRVAGSDGVHLRVRVREGAGPTIVLAHSIGCDLSLWDPLVEVLPAHYRLVAYDARGHGGSDVPPGDYRVEQLGLDALAVLDQLGIARAHYCGLSLGGTTAQWLALHHRARLDGIILADSAARLGTAEGWQARADAARTGGMASLVDMSLARFFSPGFPARAPELVERFRRVFLATSAQGFAGCCAVLRDADTRDRIGGIAVPTLVLCGAEDVPTPPADSEALARGIPAAQLAILHAGHVSAAEDPEGFAAALTAFVKG